MGDTGKLVERIATEGIRLVDFRFTDLTGRWRRTAMDAAVVSARLLEEGILIEGAAVPGWRDPNEPDILLRPDPATAFADPFAAQPTLVVVCDGTEPASGLAYGRDPRSVARRAEAWLARQSAADVAEVGIETCFHLFDDARIELGPGRAAYELQGGELASDGARAYVSGNPGQRPLPGAARFAASPADRAGDIRAEIASLLAGLGFVGLQQDHGAGLQQARFTWAPGGLVPTADRLQVFRYVAREVAASYGKTATFMPLPLAGEPGNGTAVLQTLRRGTKPAFPGQGYADLGPTCLAFIAGILRHARTLNAFTNPTTNSYRRLRRGAEEPVLLAYAAYNRSAAIRIPFAAKPQHKAVEVRFPDSALNPYLAFAAILMAGLDGIAQKLEPGDAMDRNLYDLPPVEAADLPATAASLGEALDALAADHDFLLKGEVFSTDLIQAFTALKREEIARVERVPHPVELELYFGA